MATRNRTAATASAAPSAKVKAAATRIYLVQDLSSPNSDPSPQQWLVEATSQAQALRRIVEPRYHAGAASGKTIAALMSKGVMLLPADSVPVGQAGEEAGA